MERFIDDYYKPWSMEPPRAGEDEAPKDPAAHQPHHQSYTDEDYEGHRAHSVFVGVHLPGERRHSHRRHKHHSRGDGEREDEEPDRPLTPPAQRVQFILGEEINDDMHESHPLFSQMSDLIRDGDEYEWRQRARWIKFEENVEEGGNRWSKPHVGTLSLHSLFELRSLLLNGTVMLNMEASSMEQVADLVLDNMVNTNVITSDKRGLVRDVLLRRHRHQFERRKDRMIRMGDKNNSSKNSPSCISGICGSGLQENNSKKPPPLPTSPKPSQHTALLDSGDKRGSYLAVPADYTPQVVGFTTWLTMCPAQKVDEHPQQGVLTGHTHITGIKQGDIGRYLSIPGAGNGTEESMIKSPSNASMHRINSAGDIPNGDTNHRSNTHFMRKIPAGAEASNILVGEVDFLDKPISAFIRLNTATIMGGLTEVPVPTRYIFILLGPANSKSSFHEIGRAMATLMSDEIFHEVAYRARKRDHLLAGIDEFLDAVTVLPPGEWDPAIRIEPPAAIPSQDPRKRPQEKIEDVDEEEEEQKQREESGLSRTGRLFGGLINDIKRKTPFYFSDFKDALAIQCIASWIFLYFACLSPIITFGGLLGEATGKNMAAMESLVSGFVCGMGYGFFSGQPLTILGSTGPVLVFETIVYEFCKTADWDYMSFRLWIGIWTAIILFILVAIDASAFVCYITRFTEENFATLIAFIFIYKAIENVLVIGKKFPINKNPEIELDYTCFCIPSNSSDVPMDFNWTMVDKQDCPVIKLFEIYNGTLIGDGCNTPVYYPDIFLMSIILFLGTYILSTSLKEFKNALFFPSKVRQVVSDFAVIIAILSMAFLDYYVGIATPKLEVPGEFKPTLPNRGWVINPFNRNPVWSAIVAILPALLGTILIFMDQQITAVIVNRKENKLKKGCGYHLDLFILCILILICSIMGLPWFVAATVLSINHVNSLKLESECAAPGEKPQFLGVREQRVTHILIFLMIGCSVLLTPYLRHIPMPVLFGVFLYMGAASLKGLQFFDRILIMFMPAKYQPDYMFLRQVPIRRVHMFTLIQLACLALLWIIKSFSSTSILFPLMLVVMIGVRKALDCVFTRRELKILDDVMPEMTKRNEEDMRRLGEVEDTPCGNPPPYPGNLQIPLANGNIMNIPITSINITEEVNKTAIWKQVNDVNTKSSQMAKLDVAKQKPEKKSPKNGSKHKKLSKEIQSEVDKRLSTMAEEDEDDFPITVKVGEYTSDSRF